MPKSRSGCVPIADQPPPSCRLPYQHTGRTQSIVAGPTGIGADLRRAAPAQSHLARPSCFHGRSNRSGGHRGPRMPLESIKGIPNFAALQLLREVPSRPTRRRSQGKPQRRCGSPPRRGGISGLQIGWRSSSSVARRVLPTPCSAVSRLRPEPLGGNVTLRPTRETYVDKLRLRGVDVRWRRCCI